MMSLWDALRMNMMISYQELVRTFPSFRSSLKAAPTPRPTRPLSEADVAKISLRSLRVISAASEEKTTKVR
ncbi:hypothetical protein FBF54_27270 (plasmid) [Klebsiella pneumoniae]|nr:hypothetical protein FBF55_27675 [Klebsiella pneumoniae]QHU76474.1 hypothetical protein FBF54_27270 [Klebsiella pneumoniae]